MTVAEETLRSVFRDQWGRLLALLVAQFRRLDLAEDGLADAFAAAADRWPEDGLPVNPAGWLLTAARRRILDRLRGGGGRRPQGTPAGGRGPSSLKEAQQVRVGGGGADQSRRAPAADLPCAPIRPWRRRAGAALSLRLVAGHTDG